MWQDLGATKQVGASVLGVASQKGGWVNSYTQASS